MNKSFAQADRYAVVINEIMADPSPVIGLPNAEYIELRNCSSRTIDLNKWKIEKGTNVYTIGSSTILKPDSLIIFCSKTNLPLFSNSIRAIALSSFPTLINEEGIIALKSAENKTIHAVEYKNSWHENNIKAAGGWSLEMIDPQKPCASNNWSSSIHRNGGTPGLENSIYKKNQIKDQLEVLQCISINDQTLQLHLVQGMDSNALSLASNYYINETTIPILQAKALGPLFDETALKLASPLKANTVYSINVKNIFTCKKDASFETQTQTGLQKEPLANDILINEILFDPPSGGKDFIELYNNTSAVIDAKELYVSSYNQLGGLNTSYQLTEKNYNFFPKDYLIITEDTSFIKKQWPCSISKKMIPIKTLPSLPDDEGSIVVMNKQGMLLDRLFYTSKMHHPFIHDPSGVSLERLQFNLASDEINNWHSAAASVNYATPTLENSQSKKIDSVKRFFSIDSKIISPNNDGLNEVLQINYQMDKPGYMCTVYLFGWEGNLISTIVNNKLLGTAGSLLWNGLHQQETLPSGPYILFIEAIHLRAKTIKEKLAIVIR